MSISVNDTAPAFTLYSDEKKEVSLKDYAGKNVVLLFFPMAFTGVCTKEMRDMSEDLSTYSNMKADVVGISVDSPFTLEQFKEKEGIKFPLLSDFNKEVSRNYGTIYEEFVLGMQGVSKRAAFVIDGHGTVRYAEVLEDAGNLPDFAAVKETLVSLN